MKDWTAALPEPPVTPLRWTGPWRTGHLALLDQTGGLDAGEDAFGGLAAAVAA